MLLKELSKLFTTLYISWYYEFAWNYSLSFWLLFPSLHSQARTLAAWMPTVVTTTAKQGNTTTTGNQRPSQQRKKKRTVSAQRVRPITKTAGTTGLAKGEPAIRPAVWIARFVEELVNIPFYEDSICDICGVGIYFGSLICSNRMFCKKWQNIKYTFFERMWF